MIRVGFDGFAQFTVGVLRDVFWRLRHHHVRPACVGAESATCGNATCGSCNKNSAGQCRRRKSIGVPIQRVLSLRAPESNWLTFFDPAEEHDAYFARWLARRLARLFEFADGAFDRIELRFAAFDELL